MGGVTDTAQAADDPMLILLAALAVDGALTVHNGRGGFACNSSSSHSIVVLPPDMTLTGSPVADGYYGEGGFTLTSSGDKIRYLSAVLQDKQNLRSTLDELCAAYGAGAGPLDYVDAESQFRLPTDYSGDDSVEFLTELAAFLADDRVAILGGSSGADPKRETDLLYFNHLRFDDWKVRKDTIDGQTWWVLFNVNDGTKLRLTLNADRMYATSEVRGGQGSQRGTRRHGFRPMKAPAPELVDVKLTDKCPYELACGFCYQASTRGGAEADPGQVMTLLAALAELEVFEVAFGGGEPTLWPHFGDVLDYTASLGIIPNFTTKNFTWLTSPQAPRWLDTVGAVAFSVNDLTSLKQLTSRADAADLTFEQSSKITVQLIPDLIPTADFTRILKTADERCWRVTLLGYKQTGRGSTFVPQFRREPGWWLDTCFRTAADRERPIAIDTALAAQSADALRARDVPDWMYHREEGAFSAYIDAVTRTTGPSSYCNPSQLVPLTVDGDPAAVAEEFTRLFAGFDIQDPGC